MIFLLRHGEIEGHSEKRFIGQTDLPLSVKGRRRAEKWGRVLSTIDFDFVFCSDLKRTEETAHILARGRTTAIRILPALREINLGRWEGLDMRFVRDHLEEEWAKRGENISDYKTPEGESFRELQNRVVPILEKAVKKINGHGLFISHAGVNRVFLCHVLGKPLSELFSLKQEYGGLNILDYKKRGAPRIMAFNLQLEDFSNETEKLNRGQTRKVIRFPGRIKGQSGRRWCDYNSIGSWTNSLQYESS